jgi:hypothetical protein
MPFQVCLSFYSFIIVEINLCFFSGSGSAEGFHSRLDKIMPRRVLALDDMVDFLAQEDEFWNCRTQDARLWAEKKHQFETSKERHTEKRRRLSYYYERKNRVDRSSQSLSVFDVYDGISTLFSSNEYVRDTEDEGTVN